MLRKIPLLAFPLLIAGCSTPKYNYVPERTAFSIPELNQQVSSGLGEPLLDQGTATKRDVLYIDKETGLAAYKVVPGKLFKSGEDKRYEYFTQDVTSGFSIYAGLLVSFPASTATLKLNKDTGQFCIIRPADIDICGDIETSRKKEDVLTNDSFRRTLIYSGRVGDKLKISYREFNNNMARSAFSTEVEYDLGDSNVIGYAGARLEVIKATNTEIVYRVIKNFNTL
ncbi:hypothetical protein [Vibrio harveyi]|uniref:hypothetical protein n=1 Tax=Vibrio harveyi TaxID=669 RepID=UPI002380BE56|nr:hypothetical protein [Vibrio harveyi]